jgi:bacitracin transport ATP-binding protein BcrA
MEIKVNNVTKKFKDITVLRNINIKFKSGKIYALIGRNGSGKSVFLKMICGFYTPTEGEILQDNVNYIKAKSFPISTRCLIEKPQFLPELSGYQNLKLLSSIQNKIDDKRILETLELVHLTEYKDKKYSHYSLGMKQKLGIAQVLMEDPQVIILDEPFNGIEKKTAKELRSLLKKLSDEDKIIIIASHIEDDIKELADEIYEFDDGNVEKIKIGRE